ncbi:ABC transporter substrate binding protein [[Eubacterium] yurii subsp. margaretiae ATCC 43715]|nr:ABC transporter substrate binding protein [[Eubacterium] yurii subsp. margaretiae ATCC 43715]
MKKLLSLIMASTLLLAGCTSTGGNATTGNQDNKTGQQEADGKKYKIGITQISEHPALDSARNGFIEQLKADGIDAEIVYKNAQGDMATTTTIAQNFIDEKVDLIYAISTPSAQAAKQVTSDVPIVFSAVTDPKASGIEGANITGVSDKTPVDEQLSLFKKLDPNIKKIGILYSTSETNSKIQVEEAKGLVSKHGLELVEVGINNINDMSQAVDALIGKSDAIYVITDNLVAKSIDLLTSKANEAKKIVILGYVDSSESSKNILLSNGVSYEDFGKTAADMAKKILKDKVKPSEIPVAYPDKTYNTVSMKVVKKLNLDENNEIIKGATKIE